MKTSFEIFLDKKRQSELDAILKVEHEGEFFIEPDLLPYDEFEADYEFDYDLEGMMQ